MKERDSISFSEKNKFAYATIKIVKENVINSKDPLYNPIYVFGLDKGLRYRIFWSFFDKEFNREYREICRYDPCHKLDMKDIQNKKLVIVEDIHLLSGNKELQNKIKELLMMCFEQKIQLILCSDVDIKDLEIDELLKNKILRGLVLYLER